ncbi:MAG: ester cyclase [Dehalococcoidia bacterium]|uniref:ester cyclase n=1 Tax=Candidatus Amarobacter glycogenicus TaxID=3140699 RepID=UPI003134A848|nr:ester cyclase [Dehalococcoidia bacterium]
MSIEGTRAIWEKFKAADQAHDAEGTAAIYAEDVVLKGTPLRGRETLKGFDAGFWAAFPDYRREYLQEVVEDDSVALVWRVTATHQGRWMGIEPTGIPLDWSGCSVFTFRDGHIAEAQAFQRDVMGELRREANLQLVRRLVDAENAGDIDAYAACIAANAEVWVNGQQTQTSREGQLASMQGSLHAFPDWHRETLSLTCDGDIAVLRWRGTGTHLADWAGIPASGTGVEFHGTSTVEVERGLMRRIWIDMDMAGVMRQMARTDGSP